MQHLIYCKKCNHHTTVNHLEWSAIICQSCGAEIASQQQEIRDLIKFSFDKWSDDDIEGKSELFDGTYPTVAVWFNDKEYGVECGDFDGIEEIFFFIDNANFDDLILTKKEVTND